MKIRHLVLMFFLLVCVSALNAQTMEEKIAECEKQWDQKVLRQANTAKDADYLNDICKQAFYFANLSRLDGPLFAKTFLATFSDDWHISRRSDEEWNSLQEVLARTKGLAVLIPDEPLTRAAQAHADDKDKKDHTSGDGTGASARVRDKFGCPYYRAECMAYGHFQNGLQVVLEWLVDHGNGPGYGHRSNLLHKARVLVGAGLSKETNGYDCMVFDFGIWHYTPEELLDFVRTSFPSKLVKVADVARNVDYLSDNEKNIIMLANIARVSPKLFYSKIYDEFYPWYVDKDTAYGNAFMSYEGKKMALLYPDKKIQKLLCDNLIKDGHKPESPFNIAGEKKDGNYNKYIYTFEYMEIIKCSYQMWLDPINFALAIKFLTTKDGGPGVFVKISHSVSSDNFSNQDKIVTLSDVVGDKSDYNSDNKPQKPVLIEPPSDNKPNKLINDDEEDEDDDEDDGDGDDDDDDDYHRPNHNHHHYHHHHYHRDY
jgi:hypothetical protein